MVLKYNITSCYGFPFVMLFCRLSTISFCDNEGGKELYTILWDYWSLFFILIFSSIMQTAQFFRHETILKAPDLFCKQCRIIWSVL